LTAQRQSHIFPAMLKYWLISDRSNGDTCTGRNVASPTYFISDKAPQFQKQINPTL
jgi:hypothetical protein